MILKGAWLNREKLIFFGVAGVLVLAGGYSVISEPSFAEVGQHRVKSDAPGPLMVNLHKARPGELERSLAGARPNPFAAWVPPRAVKPPKPPVRPVRPKPPKPPKPPRPPRPRPPKPPKPPPITKPPRPTTPKAYEVPVNFKGIQRTPDGRIYVLLKVKQTGENRYLSEGDIWPETGLTIKKITLTSVLLENEKGERFLMRDLYGKRAKPGKSPKA